MFELKEKTGEETLKKITAGMLVANYTAEIEKKKAEKILKFRDLVVLCYTDNSYLDSENKKSLEGKSVEPACYVRFSEPFDKNSFEILDIKGKEIELSAESARAPKDIIKIFKDFDEDDIEDVKESLKEEDLEIIQENGIYLVYPVCLEDKAKKMMELGSEISVEILDVEE